MLSSLCFMRDRKVGTLQKKKKTVLASYIIFCNDCYLHKSHKSWKIKFIVYIYCSYLHLFSNRHKLIIDRKRLVKLIELLITYISTLDKKYSQIVFLVNLSLTSSWKFRAVLDFFLGSEGFDRSINLLQLDRVKFIPVNVYKAVNYN